MKKKCFYIVVIFLAITSVLSILTDNRPFNQKPNVEVEQQVETQEEINQTQEPVERKEKGISENVLDIGVIIVVFALVSFVFIVILNCVPFGP